MKRFSLLLFAALPLVAAGNWEQLRQEALERPRQILVDDDGGDGSWNSGGRPVTEELFYSIELARYRYPQVTAFAYCPFLVALQTTTRSKIAQRYLVHRGRKNIAAELAEKFDTDPLELAARYARKNNMECFALIRLNDIHDQWTREYLPELKRRKPETMVSTDARRAPNGGWTAYDFNHPEVRGLVTGLAGEFAAYDVDGLILDFCRFPTYFKSFAWGKPVSDGERALLTGMMRQIREQTETEGRKRGCPILLGIRCPDSAEAAYALGIDLENWMKEGLFDIFFSGSDYGVFNPYGYSVELCRKYGIKNMPSIDLSWLHEARGNFFRASIPALQGQIAAAIRAGADGVYVFNQREYRNFYGFASVSGSIAEWPKLARLDKSYFTYMHHDSIHYPGDALQYRNLQRLTPNEPCALSPNEPVRRYTLQVAEDFAANDPSPEGASTTLVLKVDRRPDALTVLLNDRELVLERFTEQSNYHYHRFTPESRQNDLVDPAWGEASYHVPPELLKRGENTVELRLGAPSTEQSSRMLLKGDQVPELPEWRSMFNGSLVTNRVVKEGALRLIAGPGQTTRVMHLMPSLAGSPVAVEFELKVDPGCEPGKATLRLANGESVETADFRPGEIHLLFAGKSVRFNTADRFHRYRIEMENKTLRLSADGKLLLESDLKASVDDPATWITDNWSVCDRMHSRSLVIGAQSYPGSGGSEWKNLSVRREYGNPVVGDLALLVRFSPPRQLAYTKPEWNFEADFSNGDFPLHLPITSTYRFEKDPQQFGILLEHPEGGKRFGMSVACSNELPGNIMTAEWEIAPRRRPAHRSFPLKYPGDFFEMRMVIPAGTGGEPYLLSVRSAVSSILTNWTETDLVPNAPQTLRATVDAASGMGAVWLDGKLIGFGLLDRCAEKPGLYWGGFNPSVGGSAALKSVRLAGPETPGGRARILAVQTAPPPARIAELGSAKLAWSHDCDFTRGNMPPVPGLLSRYGKLPAAPDGNPGVLLDNAGNGFFTLPIPERAFYVTEWRARSIELPKDDWANTFQMAIWLKADRPKRISLWQRGQRLRHADFGYDVTMPSESTLLRLVVDNREGLFYLFANGKFLFSGEATAETVDVKPPYLHFGDGSGLVDGKAALEFVRFAGMDN